MSQFLFVMVLLACPGSMLVGVLLGAWLTYRLTRGLPPTVSFPRQRTVVGVAKVKEAGEKQEEKVPKVRA